MATQKISVTLDADAIARVRAAVGPRGLSSYVDAALQEKLERDERRRSLVDWLGELDAADPPTVDEQAVARARAADLVRSAGA